MAIITKLSQLDLDGTYSYADYLKWQFEERVELLRGKIARMSPAPSVKHQSIASNLHYHFRSNFERKDCRVFFAPFDVRLYNRKKSLKASQDIYTVVQPDLCVICDSSKLDEQGCNGAPELVIEILSPGNSRREIKDKFDLYQEAGVQEYWLVQPQEEVVLVYTLNEQGQYMGLRPAVDAVVSPLFPDLEIALAEVFR